MAACVVIAEGMGQGTHQGDVFHHAGGAWEMFTDMNPGHVGGYRFELAPDFNGRIGFQIEGLQMARPAVQPNEDAGCCPWRLDSLLGGRPGPGPHHFRHVYAQTGHEADMQKIPTIDAVATKQ